VLQGKTSFLGQYATLDVIILTRRDNETNQELQRNQHTVRHNTIQHNTARTLDSATHRLLLASHPTVCVLHLCCVQLPPPFDSDEVRGDILLVRMDNNSEPQPFTLAEWQQFVDAGGNLLADSSSSGDKRTEREGEVNGEEEDGAESSTGAARKKQRKT